MADIIVGLTKSPISGDEVKSYDEKNAKSYFILKKYLKGAAANLIEKLMSYSNLKSKMMNHFVTYIANKVKDDQCLAVSFNGYCNWCSKYGHKETECLVESIKTVGAHQEDEVLPSDTSEDDDGVENGSSR